LNQVESEVQLAPEILDQLRQYDTCTLENAIERFQVRLRNEGYAGPALRCLTGEFPTVVGYAVTSRARTADPPMSGRPYFEGTESWSAIDRLPAPRIAVIQDMDAQPGTGAVSGDVHCAILQRLGCVALAPTARSTTCRASVTSVFRCSRSTSPSATPMYIRSTSE
jgi:hypothetical protein